MVAACFGGVQWSYWSHYDYCRYRLRHDPFLECVGCGDMRNGRRSDWVFKDGAVTLARIAGWECQRPRRLAEEGLSVRAEFLEVSDCSLFRRYILRVTLPPQKKLVIRRISISRDLPALMYLSQRPTAPVCIQCQGITPPNPRLSRSLRSRSKPQGYMHEPTHMPPKKKQAILSP